MNRGSYCGVTLNSNWMYNNPDLNYPDGYEMMSRSELEYHLKVNKTFNLHDHLINPETKLPMSLESYAKQYTYQQFLGDQPCCGDNTDTFASYTEMLMEMYHYDLKLNAARN